MAHQMNNQKCFTSVLKNHSWRSFPILLTLFCFYSMPAFAEGPYLQDNAKVVSQEMTGKLEKVMGEIEAKNGLHLEMVILPNFYNREPNAVINAFAQQLNKNATESSKKALILIVINPTEVAIKSTANIAEAFEGNASKDIIENVKTQINAKNYDEMARVGIAGMFHYYQKKFPTIQEKPKSLLKNYFNAGLMIILAIVIVFVFRMMQKKKT